MIQFNETVLKRLILVRQLFLRGSSHFGDESEVGRVLAIQIFDYSVETLLKTVVSQLGSPDDYLPPESGYYNKIGRLKSQRYNPARIDFYRLWDEVTAVYRLPTNDIEPDNLPLRTEMNVLHNRRNDVQHHGIVPSESEVQKNAAYVESFLRQVTTDVFKQEFESVTLASLINDIELQPLLASAESHMHSGEYKESIIASTKAFEIASARERSRRPYRRHLRSLLRNDIKRLARDLKIGRTLEDFARNTGLDGWEMKKLGDGLAEALNATGDIIEDVKLELEDLRDSLSVIELGGDLRQYRRFRLLSPRLFRTMDGEWHVAPRGDWSPTKADATEVLSFVFDTVLRWQQIPLEED